MLWTPATIDVTIIESDYLLDPVDQESVVQGSLESNSHQAQAQAEVFLSKPPKKSKSCKSLIVSI